MAMARYVVGVDGGQSSTLAVLADAAGRVLGAGHAGPSNHITEPGGPERCERAVRDAVAGAVAAAGVPLEAVAFVLCGMTGAFPATAAAVDRALPRTPHRMVHDSVTAFHGATGGQPGAVVIGGTGSVGYGEDRAGNGLRLGGWGYLMGDEGSAYWVALQAAQAVARAADGRGPATMLERLLPAAVGADGVRGFHTWLYGSAERSDVARLARTVDEAASAGDAVAAAILERAGAELADLAVHVVRRLGLADGHPVVSYVGGVFRSATVRRSFRERAEREVPGARVRDPLLSPVGGAVLLALREVQGAIAEDTVTRLRESLAQFDVK